MHLIHLIHSLCSYTANLHPPLPPIKSPRHSRLSDTLWLALLLRWAEPAVQSYVTWNGCKKYSVVINIVCSPVRSGASC